MAIPDAPCRAAMFVARQWRQIRERGPRELKRKLRRLLQLGFRYLLFLLVLPFVFPMVLVIRLIKPFLLVRFYRVISWRIGHFAANIELYLCEQDAGINRPEGHYIDLWYYPCEPCNRQLSRMWKRVLHVGPRWLVVPMERINAFIPGGDIHSIGNNCQGDMDVHNLTDRFPPHLGFLPEEERRGEAGLRDMGIPEGAPFVALIVRDSSYLHNQSSHIDWSYHDYRDCSIQNYVPAARELAERGYYVVRMGAVVEEPLDVDHPMIIDYAANGMRSDFMDIYLGAKCTFCISGNSGFEALPYIFRRPMVYVDYVPLGLMRTDSQRLIATTKKHWLRDAGRFMTFREIMDRVGYCDVSGGYEEAWVELIESEPAEITEVVLEMEERLRGVRQTTEEDEALQRRFWDIFPDSEYHGEVRSRMGAGFLRRHKDWLS